MSRLVTTIRELREYREAVQGSVALVPTMGALHEGHLALIRRAREMADVVIVSNFVNPLQFGPGEDYERYPRDLDADLETVGDVADVMFAPSPEHMYPIEPPMRIDVGPMGEVFEGAFRPGHFSGVATVVMHLLTLTRPQYAIFGKKDAQQLAIVRTLVRNFHVDVEVIGLDIVREESGLARSSRNVYLSEPAKRDALALSGLVAACHEVRTAAELRDLLAGPRFRDGVQWDYREAVEPSTLEPIHAAHVGEVLVLLAARVEGVRLLDNATLTLAP